MEEESGERRLTPTEKRILLLIERLDGNNCTKAEMAEILGRNEKTVDRLLSRLRREGIVESRPAFEGNGAQRANSYRVLKEPEEE